MKKTINDNAAKLSRLNKLFKTLNALSAKSEKACRQFVSPKEVDKLYAKFREQAAEFDRLRWAMPPVKFDMGLGEYFYAEQDGMEMFAVKVRPTSAYYVHVPARSAGEALDKAKMMIAERERIPLCNLEAVDYSR